MTFYLKVLRNGFIAVFVFTVIALLVLQHAEYFSTDDVEIFHQLEPPFAYRPRSKTRDEIAESYNRFLKLKIDHNEPAKRIHVDLTPFRINRLLRRVQEFEGQFEEQLEHLEVMSIDRVVRSLDQNGSYYRQYEYEFNEFTTRVDGHLQVNEKFADMLDKRSDFFTFANPVKDLSKIPLKKPIKLLTAANEKYFGFLCNSLDRLININFFPEIYIYDLGFSEESSKRLRENYKRLNITVRKFFDNQIITSKFPHFKHIKNYAWKPIIIQEIFKTLEEDETFIYIDTAVVIRNNLIHQLVHYSQETGGFYIPIIYFNFTCFSNPKAFEWFREDAKNFILMGSHLHAAFIFLTKNFITTLILKSWVTCALDKNCIDPEGARLDPCCGCHRYDQTALQIILSHFFTYPINYRQFYPAYGSFFQGHDLYHFLAERP